MIADIFGKETVMQNEDTIIMIKNALLSGDAVASYVLSCLMSLIV